MTILVGSYNAYWGHTFLAEGIDKIYALRSLAQSSSLCTFDKTQFDESEDIIELASLGLPMVESFTIGEHSCHITLLAREAVIADYTSGTLSLFPLDEKGCVDGAPRLLHFEGCGPNKRRQQSSHIHSSALSPDGNMLVVMDLGADKIYRFAVDKGRVVVPQLSEITLPSGCGPRHSVYSADGKYLYVVTELSDEVLVYRTSDFSLQNRYTLHSENPEGGSHIALSPNGRYLYVSMRVSSTAGAERCKISDGIAIFECLTDGELKMLHYLPTGAHPRHFAITHDGERLIVACRDDNAVEIYPLNSESGIPTDGLIEKFEVEKPVYIGLKQNIL